MQFLVLLSAVPVMADSGRNLQASEADAPGPVSVLEKLEKRGLPNLHRLTNRVYFGGQPKTDSGFASLRELGVQTVISVDGMRPDVSSGRKFNLRYVHLPHGYDCVPEQRVLDIARAITTLPGPVYIHCHHGHHRSPAAAACGCIAAGLIPPGTGQIVLTSAQTGKEYSGLYRSECPTAAWKETTARSGSGLYQVGMS